MAWLLGIIVLILAVVFWRASLVIVGIAVAGGVLLWQFSEAQTRKDRNAKLETLRERAAMIAEAKQTASPKSWEIDFHDDPASSVQTARTAWVASDDGLCAIMVEARIDGSNLTGLDCPKLPFSPYDPLEIKFDGDSNSFKMSIENYSGNYGSKPNVYIPTYQNYKSNLTYDDFIQRLAERKSFAIKLHAENHWVKFSGDGAERAINSLGSQREKPSQ